jgi:PAS domain S-box-containing protein
LKTAVLAVLQRLTPGQLWSLSVVLAVLLTEAVVSVMGLLLKGEIPPDYLIAGLVTSLLVSALVAALLSTLFEALQENIHEHKRIEVDMRIGAIAFESQNGIMVTDAHGVITRVNQAFTRITGYSAAEVTGKTPAILHSGRQGREFYERMWTTLKMNESWQGEIWNKRKNGEIYAEWLSITPIKGSDGKVTHHVGTFSDITAHKQMEQQSTRLLNRLQMSMDTSLEGIHVLDIEGNLLEANDAFCHMLGYTQEESTRLNVADWEAQWTVDELRLMLKEIIGKSRVFETVLRRKDGTLINAEISATGRNIDGHDYIYAFCRDITERKTAERQLRELTAHIQSVREDEKGRIAREIHDGLGGKLTALKIEVYQLASKLSGDQHAPLLEHAESMAQLIDSSVNVMRQVISDLHPAILDDLGLVAALEWEGEQFQKRTGIACDIISSEEHDGKSKLNKTQIINLFRIFQEAITNVSRHSEAARVEVEFLQGQEEIILSISDNGRGMPKEYIVRHTSYGMRGMRERVAQLGGQIKFDSPPGGGFRITVLLPLPPGRNMEAAA